MDDPILNRELFEELLKTSRQADREDRELTEFMQSLVASPAWRAYNGRVLGPRLQSFGEILLQPSGSEDGAWRSEFVKGALYGLCLARDLPSVIIASMKKPTPAEDGPDEDA